MKQWQLHHSKRSKTNSLSGSRVLYLPSARVITLSLWSMDCLSNTNNRFVCLTWIIGLFQTVVCYTSGSESCYWNPTSTNLHILNVSLIRQSYSKCAVLRGPRIRVENPFATRPQYSISHSVLFCILHVLVNVVGHLAIPSIQKILCTVYMLHTDEMVQVVCSMPCGTQLLTLSFVFAPSVVCFKGFCWGFQLVCVLSAGLCMINA